MDIATILEDGAEKLDELAARFSEQYGSVDLNLDSITKAEREEFAGKVQEVADSIVAAAVTFVAALDEEPGAPG